MARKPKKENKKKRRAVSDRRMKYLGYSFANFVEAEGAIDIDVSLAQLCETDEQLKKAWLRGQFLRNLAAEAESSPSLLRAAKHLNFANPAAFKDFLDSDMEARNIWDQKREELAAIQNKRIFDLAANGVSWAVKLVEKFIECGDEEKVSNKTDIYHLLQKDIGELFSVSRITVNQWERENNCPRNQDGTYNLIDVINWHSNFLLARNIAPKTPDKLRDLKARKEEIRVAELEGLLWNKVDVIESFVVRWKSICAVFSTKVYGLAEMCHGQTVESTRQIISGFFEDLQNELIRQFNESSLLEPDEAEALIKVYEIIQRKGLATEGTENTEKGKL